MIKILQGDCLIKLKELEDNSVDCVVTSPPYWALRDYGVSGQLGLEPTFQEYITKLCDIFDEVKRVLKDEGTCWVNIGDTYGNSMMGMNERIQKEANNKNSKFVNKEFKKPKVKTGLPEKCLCCIPDRFKIEMINRGWICRNEIIWFKPNCMPSSVKDRFTVDYEKVFFFVKQKKYFFKTQYEKLAESSLKDPRLDKGREEHIGKSATKNYGCNATVINSQGRNKRCVWDFSKYDNKEQESELRKDKIYDVKELYKNNVPYSVQPRTKEIVEYRNLPELKEFSLWLNNSRKSVKITIDEIENLHQSQAPHHWFNGESFPPKEDYLWLKEKLNLDERYDEQMLNIFEKSSEKTTSEQGRNKRCVWDFSKYDNKEQESEVRQGMHKERGEGLVEKRNLPNQKEFVDKLRDNFTTEQIAEKVGIPLTKVEHWFRYDESGFSYPSKEDWEKLETDLFPELKEVWYETDDIKASPEGRIKRTVWQVNTKPFKEAHFATYPEKLIEPMIDAGCPVGGIVLDPFAGSGTTGVVAKKQSKDFIGIELNEEYIKIAEARINSIEVQTKLEVKSGCDANDNGIPPSNELLGILPTIL